MKTRRKLHTITADNTSTNSQMGHNVQILIPSFTTQTNYLGCIAHFINLGARAVLAVLNE
ncbi:hypothetical protein VP01_1769g5 [Puccinia sorghi]|uniref:Uncharacterized protein n=1 Tax=Puccinia sorghi TaxID=27349 RepID=A0A0L6VGN5_9BASI|nr:hypothetical protein VP01_1769g5 [Puccinia sorghi]